METNQVYEKICDICNHPMELIEKAGDFKDRPDDHVYYNELRWLKGYDISDGRAIYFQCPKCLLIKGNLYWLASYDCLPTDDIDYFLHVHDLDFESWKRKLDQYLCSNKLDITDLT